MPVACTVSHEYPDVRVYQKDDMIYSVEGFWEVKKNTYEKFTSVKDSGDLIRQVD